ncbi:glycoside hydrolase family 2 TIM barrel-domain containing protein [Marinimicrobium agarilyticum]|uniref:glycoside hydrolase family 2 TIM barrel-domain containing protein n=1 Tax=Marinimicrobium agarilyticum TaxID=306546 RepID=UPI0003F6F6B4|nr:glycoside hydrolase family 2 TIM barrel-domain containing protein [Marinimicrobium agarilyticum]
MNKKLLLLLSGALTLGACGQTDTSAHSPVAPTSSVPDSGAIPVSVKQNDSGHYSIYRNGQPYFIRGAGGTSRLDQLAAAGANSLRTWDTDNAQQILDKAESLGLTVMLGLRMGKERHGFDYGDAQAVQAQKEAIREKVLQFKDHPALLTWGIGNELDLFYTNTDVWYAVEDIAQMIRSLDPNHLITTVTAGLDQEKANLIQKRVPSIDYLSINMYGDLSTLPQKMRKVGWPGAYAVTEWGPTGHWEVARTEWDVPIEQTSTEKAQAYRERYESAILGDPEKGLGSYAFLWGQKQETTPTWYGMFLESGDATEVVDTMQHQWSGEWPVHRAPSIRSFQIDGQVARDSIYLEAGQVYDANIEAHHPDGEAFEITWEFLPESTDIKSGGDREKRPASIQGLVVKDEGDGTIRFTAPKKAGPYRLFTYITTEHNRAATANVPFFVK